LPPPSRRGSGARVSKLPPADNKMTRASNYVREASKSKQFCGNVKIEPAGASL
jgi:hypothetical protein